MSVCYDVEAYAGERLKDSLVYRFEGRLHNNRHLKAKRRKNLIVST